MKVDLIQHLSIACFFRKVFSVFFLVNLLILSTFTLAQKPERYNGPENITISEDSTVTVILSEIYQAGSFHRFWLGENYREIWETEVTLPVFNISKIKGGLEIVKKGGGQQTTSIRLRDKNGNEYVLRSVNKKVEKALDETLRNTIIEDIVQDEISASHPYAAITVPVLAEAIGVYHTNPRIYWVPDDPELGVFRKDIANGVFLFEERPDDNCEHIESFGNSKNVKSTSKVVEKTMEEPDHRVDQVSVVRARLFDILINDWDRHDDQWRWASFEEDGIKKYKPIPRDRDQVYFVNQGPLMWIASRNFIMPKFQGLDYEIENVSGLGFNARFFDRYFLTEPELNDWIEQAEYIKHHLADSIIHKAMLELPPQVYQICGQDIEQKLRSRRDKLVKYAEEYYRFLARKVDVVGTNENDYFKLKRSSNGNLEVEVFELSDKDGKIKNSYYHRVFKPDETREVRLYGLKKDDNFEVSGTGKKGIKVRMIGGTGEDFFTDSSKVRGLSRKTIIYDRKDKDNIYYTAGEARLELGKDKSINVYDRKQFKWNKTMPLISAGFNIDDGVYFGTGIDIKNYNFRDSSFHKISGHVAFQTGAFDFRYRGLLSSVSRYFNLLINAELGFPRNVDNFFGLGNETKKDFDDKSFYKVRYKYAMLNPMINQEIGNNLDYSIGIFYQFFKLTDTAGKYINVLFNEKLVRQSAFQSHQYLGINSTICFDTRNNKILPDNGFMLNASASGYLGIDRSKNKFLRFSGNLSWYQRFDKNARIILALRMGASVNIGEYEFFHANYLGGKSNLRGFQANRFAGDALIYQNTELRIRLLNINSYIFRGKTGIILFNDIGRVWYDDDNSDRWHDGYGLGFWFYPFEFTIITMGYSMSNEDKLFSIDFNFLF